MKNSRQLISALIISLSLFTVLPTVVYAQAIEEKCQAEKSLEAGEFTACRFQ